MLWQLVARAVPFADLTPIQAAFAVAKEDRRPLIPPHTPMDLASLMEQAWNADQLARPSFFFVVQSLASIIRNRFSPANVSLQTVKLANDALQNVAGVNCTVNIGSDVMLFDEEEEGEGGGRMSRNTSRLSLQGLEAAWGGEEGGQGGQGGRGGGGVTKSGLSMALDSFAGEDEARGKLTRGKTAHGL